MSFALGTTTPGSPDWDRRDDVVARAVALIADGVVERTGVTGLASMLGIGARPLNELVVAELGATPARIARDHGRAIARSATSRSTTASPPASPLHLMLAARPPYDPAVTLEFLGQRAVPGIEHAEDGRYTRTLSLPHGHGVASVEPSTSSTGVDVELTLEDAGDLTPAVARLRRLFDLDSDPQVVDEHLAADPLLAPLVAASPGRRVPGTVDVFETAVRAVVGQQISIAGARTVTGRIVRALGEPIRPSLACAAAPCELVFPSPDAVAAAPPDVFAMPGRRKASIVALGRAVVDGDLCLDASITRAELASQLLALPGIGPWTAEYIAMRGRGDPDAYLPTDLGVVRAIAELRGATVDPQRWRPWRAYALHHLWAIPHGAA